MDIPEEKKQPTCQLSARIYVFDALYRVVSKFFLKFFIRTPVTPNQLTVSAGLFSIVASILLMSQSRAYLVVAGVLIQVYAILDCVDGDLARAKGMTSTLGAWLDAFFNKLSDFCMIAGLSLGVYLRTGNIYALHLGLILMGMEFLIQFFMAYNALLSQDRPAPTQPPENTFDTNNSRLLKEIYRFVSRHFALGEMGLWFLLSLFALTNTLFFGLIFLTAHATLTFIFNSGWHLYKLYRSEQNF